MAENKQHLSETVVSISILLVLFGIGLGVFYQQFTLNPAVLSVQSTESMISRRPMSSDADTVRAIISLPENLVPMTPAETFEPQNLSDKIDGKAELYLSAGFRKLQSQRFTIRDRSDLWMELFLFDMGGGANAYAVFSGQRRDDAVPLNITPYAYQTENALFLAHGPYYMEIIGAQESTALANAMHVLAETFVEKNRDTSIAVDPADLFPKPNLEQSSLTLLSKDAFGYEKFSQVYIAEYLIDDTTLTAFISRRKTPEEAKAIMTGYRTFLISFGGKDIGTELGGLDFEAVDILGAFELFFSHGPYVAGVHESADMRQGNKLILMLKQHLSLVGGDS
jgi:uncharacterized protein DUF6599